MTVICGIKFACPCIKPSNHYKEVVMTSSRNDFFLGGCGTRGVKLLWISERQAVASTLHSMEQAELVDWTKLKSRISTNVDLKLIFSRMTEHYEYSN